MTSSNYAYQTLDDIVFEGRNREYGAYLLRKIYTQNLWRGLVTAIALFLVLLSIPLIATKLQPEAPFVPVSKPVDDGLTIIPIEIPDIPKEITPPPVEVTPPATATKVKSIIYTVPKIVKNPAEVTNVPDQGTLNQNTIGAQNSDGETGINQPITTTTGPVGGTGTVADPPVFVISDEMPQFPGGEAAMMQYLAKNIEFPALARRNGIEGMVVLQFIVNQYGDISNITVLKGLGAGTEAEAIRVLKKMPQWKPGKNNGIPVNVRFTLPIRFSLK